MRTLPAIFFPTQTIIIDDNSQFLESLSLSLSYKAGSYKFFSNPVKALAFIKDNIEESNLIKSYITLLEEEEADHKTLDISISDLYKEVFNNERFRVITNIIVDYDMPILNGLEFCKELEDVTTINKILLSGAVDDKAAIDAFNKKLINCFIPKNQDNIIKLIHTAIHNGVTQYFNNLSQIIYVSIRANKKNIIFDHHLFISFLNSIIQEKNIVEYYLIEENGSYLMIDDKGRANILHLCEDNMIDYFYNIALEEDLDNELLAELKNRSKIFFYHDINKKELPNINEWGNYLKTPQILTLEDKNYYYHFEENISSMPQIMDFNSFINK